MQFNFRLRRVVLASYAQIRRSYELSLTVNLQLFTLNSFKLLTSVPVRRDARCAETQEQ